jgi:hypothetical protein
MNAYRESSSSSAAAPIRNLSMLSIYGFNLFENIDLAL